MTCSFYDWIGFIGVIIVLVSYLLLQISVIKVEGMAYSASNAIGSVLLLYSLYHDWNLSAVIIEVFWLGISLYGMVKVLILKRKKKYPK